MTGSNAPSADQAIHARVAILTEAGPALGLGHLVRCTALYDALECMGASCELLVAGGAAAHVVADRRVRLCEWRTGGDVAPLLAEADCAVIDSYHASQEIYRSIAASVSVTACFDDTARLEYPPGIIVNGMPEADTLGLPVGPDHVLLLGARYQVLRREYWELLPKAVAPRVQRLIVIAGGTDAAGARAGMTDAAREAFPDAEIDVVDAPKTAAAMCRAMAEADIALSAAGQTLYELAALGTPTVAVCVADNQRAQAHAFERAGAVLLAGDWGEPETASRITECLAELAGDERRGNMAQSARRLVDGHGALRVARSIVGSVLARRLEIRRAEASDEADLLDLANDPVVREMSFSTDPIDARTHHEWLQRTVRDQHTLLLVGTERGLFLGQVRFDLEPEATDPTALVARVSISVAPRYRGLGVAGLLLERATTVLRREHPRTTALEAFVREENRASRLLFESAGFMVAEASLAASGGTCARSEALVYMRHL